MEVLGVEARFECGCLRVSVPSAHSPLPLLWQLAVGVTLLEEFRWNSRIPAPSITQYHTVSCGAKTRIGEE